MKFKYLGLLILFILNLSATVIADSSHFHTEQTQVSHSERESELQNADSHKTEKTNCHESHCCHAGHIHHLLITSSEITLSINSSLYYFPEHHFSPSETHSDLIKPPKV